MSAPFDIHDAYASLDDYSKQLEAKLSLAKEALEGLYGAMLNEMAVLDLPHEWAANSAMAKAREALEKLNSKE